MNNLSYMKKCFEAFKDVEATVVLVVGKKINISQI